MSDVNVSISRRRAIVLGGSVAGGLMAAATPLLGRLPAADAASPRHDAAGGNDRAFSPATIRQMEAILQTSGMQQNGVLSFEIDRDDLKDYTLGGNIYPTIVPFKPSWENNGTFYFQNLGNGQAIFNGDFGGLLPHEINPFIDQLLAHGLIIQAYHQHFPDIHPTQLFFIHMRGVGDPLALARGLHAAVKVTSTPLPQSAPANPTTPLHATHLSQILGGPATVGSDGVVTVNVPRRDHLLLGGVPINPFLNVAAPISFLPLNSSGTLVAAAPDFNMVASEIQNVLGVMRQQGWAIGCLYNQETDEQPQLYFSHQLKVGDPITLAHEIRNGLDRMNVV